MTQQELVRQVEWKDLKSLTLKEMLIENNLTIGIFWTLHLGVAVFCIFLFDRIATSAQWFSQLLGNKQVFDLAFALYQQYFNDGFHPCGKIQSHSTP